MLHLDDSTQNLIQEMIDDDSLVIIEKKDLISVLATLEEQFDPESELARQEAENDIKSGRLSSLDSVLTE